MFNFYYFSLKRKCCEHVFSTRQLSCSCVMKIIDLSASTVDHSDSSDLQWKPATPALLLNLNLEIENMMNSFLTMKHTHPDWRLQSGTDQTSAVSSSYYPWENCLDVKIKLLLWFLFIFSYLDWSQQQMTITSESVLHNISSTSFKQHSWHFHTINLRSFKRYNSSILLMPI